MSPHTQNHTLSLYWATAVMAMRMELPSASPVVSTMAALCTTMS